MIDAPAINEILALYKKHGWKLRRVLLSAAMQKRLSSSLNIFGDVEITLSTLDAVWFSRSSRPGSETWELRLLVEAPFALIALIDNDIDALEVSEILRNTELKMMQTTLKGIRSH